MLFFLREQKSLLLVANRLSHVIFNMLQVCKRDLVIRKKRPDIDLGLSILHQDNAPAHRVSSVLLEIDLPQFELLEHPSYSPGPKVIILFSCSTQLSMKIFLPINVKMPTIVGILTFHEQKNSILGLSEPEKC